MRLLFILLVFPLLCGFQITEMMYDPEGQDNNREYIEIFVNDTNLSELLFEDLVSSDVLTLVQFFDGPYALVVEERFNATDLNITVYSAGATIGNGLNNEEDLVLFRTNESILDAVFYSSSRDGGRNNGKALCVRDHLLYECMPTPGIDNNLNHTQEEQNYTLWISEFLPDPRGDDRSPRPHGEWVELYNYGDRPLDLRGLLVQDARNTTLIISDVHLDTPFLAPASYDVVYFNGQSLLNNEGLETVRLVREQQTFDIVSYSSSKEGLSWSRDLTHHIFTLAQPTPGAAHHPEPVSLNSSLVLERVYVGNDDVVRFGESFRVRLRAYKGDTEKTTIALFVANMSKQTTVSIEEPFAEHVFTLTLPLVPNCHGKLADGTYTVTAEGLGAIATLPVTIKGNAKDNCILIEQNTTKETLTLKKAPQTKTIDLQTVITASPDIFINASERIVYEASDYKAKRWAVYFFCFTLLLVVAALFTRD